MASQLDLDLGSAQKERLFQLNGLDEFRMQALLHTEVVQLQRNIWHDKNIKENQFRREIGHCYMILGIKTSRAS